MLVLAGVNSSDKDASDIPFITSIQDDGIVFLDALSGGLFHIVNFKCGCWKLGAVLKRNLEFEIKVFHPISVVPDLKVGRPHPLAQFNTAFHGGTI